jgi:hypothetical protein
VIAFLFPVQRYEVTIERTFTIDSPMRTVRDCLVERYDEIKALEPGVRSRLYLHLPPGKVLTHNYYYYYRGLDVWERPETLDDQRLHRRLFTAGELAPTLILEDTYRDFLNRTDTTAPRLPDGLDFGAGGDGVTPALMLLPGPFDVCAEEGVRQGGRRYDHGLPVPDLPRLP